MYQIDIVETLKKSVFIEAEDIEVAINKVINQYQDEQIVLDYADFSNVKFIEKGKIKEKKALTYEVIDYLYDEEQRHFEESGKPNDHIFLKIKKLKSLL